MPSWIDQARSGIADVTGVNAYLQSDTGQTQARRMMNADGPLDQFNTLVGTGTDVILDNPAASVQETSQGLMHTLTGTDDDADLAEGIQSGSRSINRMFESTVRDVAGDHTGTDVVLGATDAIVSEPLQSGFEAVTGVSTGDGGTEAQTGTLDIFNTGLTGAGAAAAGRLGLAGARTAGTAAARAADGPAADVADNAGSLLDDLGARLPNIGGAADDAARSVTNRGGALGRMISRGADEATDAVGAGVRAAGQGTKSLVTSRPFQFGLGATGAVLGGGAAYDAFFDGSGGPTQASGQPTGDDQPGSDAPTGNWTQWQEAGQAPQENPVFQLYERYHSDGRVAASAQHMDTGRWLQSDGSIGISRHSFSPPRTISSALKQYMSENANGDGDGEDDGSGWTEWQRITTAGPWTIWARSNESEGKAEYVAKASRDGQTVYLQPDGSAASNRHVYANERELNRALEAWRSSGGEDDVEPSSGPPGGGGGARRGPSVTGSRGILSIAASNPIATAAVVGLAAYVAYQYHEHGEFRLPFSGESTPGVK